LGVGGEGGNRSGENRQIRDHEDYENPDDHNPPFDAVGFIRFGDPTKELAYGVGGGIFRLRILDFLTIHTITHPNSKAMGLKGA
jgi:hypothetical protein